MLCQETSDTGQEDKGLYLPIVRTRSEKGTCLSPYIRSFDFAHSDRHKLSTDISTSLKSATDAMYLMDKLHVKMS